MNYWTLLVGFTDLRIWIVQLWNTVLKSTVRPFIHTMLLEDPEKHVSCLGLPESYLVVVSTADVREVKICLQSSHAAPFLESTVRPGRRGKHTMQGSLAVQSCRIHRSGRGLALLTGVLVQVHHRFRTSRSVLVRRLRISNIPLYNAGIAWRPVAYSVHCTQHSA